MTSSANYRSAMLSFHELPTLKKYPHMLIGYLQTSLVSLCTKEVARNHGLPKSAPTCHDSNDLQTVAGLVACSLQLAGAAVCFGSSQVVSSADCSTGADMLEV